MGLFDSLKKLGEAVEVLNEAANTASKTTIEDFGEPVYSLYTALELGDLHRRIDITDDQNNVKYYTKSSIVAITGKTDIMDAEGNVIAHLEKRPVSIEQIEESLTHIKARIRSIGEREIKSSVIGEYVMEALKALDEVAYVRFASVYRRFTDVKEFGDEIARLREGKF